MKHSITPEEHARVQRRRGRQALGLLVAILVVVGFFTVLRAGVGAVANLFDDTAQKQEYEDKLEGLVLFDPMPFDGIENIDDLTLREAAVWGCIYSIQETQDGFDNYNTDPDTEQLLLPSLDVDAYLAKLLGPGFKLTHRSFAQSQVVDVLNAVKWHGVKQHKPFQLIFIFLLLGGIIEQVRHRAHTGPQHGNKAHDHQNGNQKAQCLPPAAALHPGMFFRGNIMFHSCFISQGSQMLQCPVYHIPAHCAKLCPWFFCEKRIPYSHVFHTSGW